MTSMKKLAATTAITALLGVGAILASAPAASADAVCNRDGDCWYVNDRDDYSARFGVRYSYDNDWYWRHYGWRHHHWRHHYGRGYWRNGVWIQF